MEMIRVTPEEFVNTISQFKSSKDMAQNAYLQMIAAVFALDNTWDGEANEAFKASFNDLVNNLKTSDATLDEAVKDLENAKVMYENVEYEIKGLMDSMSDTTDPFKG